MIIKASSGKVFKRIHDNFVMGNILNLGMDYSTGIPRQDLPEYYEEIENETTSGMEDPRISVIENDVKVIKETINTENVDLSNLSISEAKASLINQLDKLSDQLTIIITKAKIKNDPEPPELTYLIKMSIGLYAYAKNEIEALTEDNYKTYVLKGVQVEQLFAALNRYL